MKDANTEARISDYPSSTLGDAFGARFNVGSTEWTTAFAETSASIAHRWQMMVTSTYTGC